MKTDFDELVAKAVELDDLRRWRRILVPTMCLAIAVQSLALHRLLATGTGWTGSILATMIAGVAAAWTGLSQRRIQRLEDELE